MSLEAKMLVSRMTDIDYKRIRVNASFSRDIFSDEMWVRSWVVTFDDMVSVSREEGGKPVLVVTKTEYTESQVRQFEKIVRKASEFVRNATVKNRTFDEKLIGAYEHD